MFNKNIGHPLFLYAVFIFLLFALFSNFVVAQTAPVCTSNPLSRSCSAYPTPVLSGGSCQPVNTDGILVSGPNPTGTYTLERFYCNESCGGSSEFAGYFGGKCNYMGSACPEGQSWFYSESGFTCQNDQPICVYPNVAVGNDCVCDVGYDTQGYINGQPICQQQCPEGTFAGAVNGVSGCYGAGEQPDCPQGSYYGAVNGVWGCWGGDGSGGSNSSGGSASSSGGGSGSSAGSGGGDSGGEGGGGYEGVPYDPSEPCPGGYEKTANNTCEGQGDCFPGYTSVVISQSPFYAMCLPDEPPPSSSSSSQSSSSSSQQSSGAGAGSSSGGGGSSSGSGGGGIGEEPGAGQCDPTASNYMDCITPSGDMPSHTVTESGATTFAQVNQNFFNSLSQTAPMVAMANMTGFIELESPACPSFSIDLSDTIIGRTIATDLHCILWEDIAGVLTVCMIGVWLWLGFRVFASA